ncbi:hypothetical protein HII31_06636 [Pseudocercospora fuligena]|uniref:Uncharacterized protein n=1 Tax=Pseudocercospora fuligena TaxID=685502 RepID=A0A8H6RL08_9PEZI|nr:hypothetical protein HII31_06636 [Pseudocercospora fuligena]
MAPTTRSRSQSRGRSRAPAADVLQEISFTYDPNEDVILSARSRPRSRSAKRAPSRLSKAWRLLAQVLSLAVVIFAILVYWSYHYVPSTQTADPTWVLKAPIGLAHYKEVANASSDALKQYHLGHDMKDIIKNTDEIVNSTEAFSRGALSEVLAVDKRDFSVTLYQGEDLQKQAKALQDQIHHTKDILMSQGLLKGMIDLSKINTTRWTNKNILARRENLTSSTGQTLHNMTQTLIKLRISPNRDPLLIWKEYLSSRVEASNEIYSSAETLLNLAMQFSTTWSQYVETLGEHREWAENACRQLEKSHFLIFWSRPKYCRISDGVWYNFEKIDDKIGLSLLRLKAPYVRVQLAYKSLGRHLGNVEETIEGLKRFEEFEELADPFTKVEIPEDVEGYLADQAEVAMGMLARVVEEEKGFKKEGWMRNYKGAPLLGKTA